MLTQPEIEAALGRFHHLRPPRDIYVFNQPIRADRLHDAYPTDCRMCAAFHAMNAEARAHKFVIYGITPAAGRSDIYLSSTAPTRTLLHETLHRNGVGSESFCHAVAPVMARKVAHRPWRSPREVHYQEVPVGGEEGEQILRRMKLREDGTPLHITHYRLVAPRADSYTWDPTVHVPLTVNVPKMDLLYDPRYDLQYDPGY